MPITNNADFPREGRCLVFRKYSTAARDCRGCRTIANCPDYKKGQTTMIYWVNLIALILQAGETELPAFEALISDLKGASPAHQATVNTAVKAALIAKPAKFPGSADATSFPVRAAV
jgi:hypothetical protein